MKPAYFICGTLASFERLWGFLRIVPAGYTITVTATATSAANTTLQHTTTVTLTIQ
jgi:hypothetical protein